MTLTERDVERLLARIRQFVADGRIRFTNKALDELDDRELNISFHDEDEPDAQETD